MSLDMIMQNQNMVKKKSCVIWIQTDSLYTYKTADIYKDKPVNPSIRIWINKIENRITFKIKTVYYLELLTSQTMELLGSTKSKITKNENGENVPNLELTEAALVHCNIVNNNYQRNLRLLYTFVPNKSFG